MKGMYKMARMKHRGIKVMLCEIHGHVTSGVIGHGHKVIKVSCNPSCKDHIRPNK